MAKHTRNMRIATRGARGTRKTSVVHVVRTLRYGVSRQRRMNEGVVNDVSPQWAV